MLLPWSLWSYCLPESSAFGLVIGFQSKILWSRQIFGTLGCVASKVRLCPTVVSLKRVKAVPRDSNAELVVTWLQLSTWYSVIILSLSEHTIRHSKVMYPERARLQLLTTSLCDPQIPQASENEILFLLKLPCPDIYASGMAEHLEVGDSKPTTVTLAITSASRKLKRMLATDTLALKLTTKFSTFTWLVPNRIFKACSQGVAYP